MRGVLTKLSTPAACQAQGSGLTSAMSSPVNTPMTPGMAFALLVSMLRMFACATGERSTAA